MVQRQSRVPAAKEWVPVCDRSGRGSRESGGAGITGRDSANAIRQSAHVAGMAGGNAVAEVNEPTQAGPFELEAAFAANPARGELRSSGPYRASLAASPLRRRSIHPLLNDRWRVGLEPRQQFSWGSRRHDHRAMLGSEEPLFYGVVKEGQEPIEVASYVEESTRFRVEPELRPRDDLEELLQRAETSGESDKAV